MVESLLKMLSIILPLIIFLLPFISNFLIEDSAITTLFVENSTEFKKKHVCIKYFNKRFLVYLIGIFLVCRVLAYILILIANYVNVKIYFSNIIILIGVVICIGLYIHDIIKCDTLLVTALPMPIMLQVILIESSAYDIRINEIGKYITLKADIMESFYNFSILYNPIFIISILLDALIVIICVYLFNYYRQYKIRCNNIRVNIYTNELKCCEIPFNKIKNSMHYINIKDENRVYSISKDKILLKEYKYIE